MATKRRRRRSGVFRRSKGRVRRIRVHRVSARSHGLRKRSYYRGNPRRRSRRRHSNPLGKGLFKMLDIKMILGAALGGVLVPYVLKKAKVGQDPNSALGKGWCQVAVQAAAGAVIGGLIAKQFKQQQLGTGFAIGAAAIAAAPMLKPMLPLSGLGEDAENFPDLVAGGMYAGSESIGELEQEIPGMEGF